MGALRFLFGAIIAAGIVAGLFLMMRAMTEPDWDLPPPVVIEDVPLEIVREEERPEPDRIDPGPTEAPEPPEVDLSVPTPGPGDTEPLPVLPPDFPEPSVGGGNEATALVRLPPDYPPGEVGRYDVPVSVEVEFDLTAEGTVENARIVSIEPPDASNAFKQAALRAVQRFRYAPATDESGKPVPAPGQRVRLRFEPPGSETG